MDKNLKHLTRFDSPPSPTLRREELEATTQSEQNPITRGAGAYPSGLQYHDADLSWVPTTPLRSLACRLYPRLFRSYVCMESLGMFFVNFFGLEESSYIRKSSTHEGHQSFGERSTNCVERGDTDVRRNGPIDGDVGMHDDGLSPSSHVVRVSNGIHDRGNSCGSYGPSPFNSVPRGFPIDELPLELCD